MSSKRSEAASCSEHLAELSVFLLIRVFVGVCGELFQKRGISSWGLGLVLVQVTSYGLLW